MSVYLPMYCESVAAVAEVSAVAVVAVVVIVSEPEPVRRGKPL